MLIRRQQLGAFALALARLPVPRGERGRAGLPRPRRDDHARREAGADRLALADGDRDALRDRRRQAGGRRRRPVELPGERRRARSSRGSRRTSRRSRRYKPDLVVGEAGLTKLAGSFKAVGIPLLVEPSAPSLADAYKQIDDLGKATGHRAGAAALVARMKTQIAAIVKSVPKGGGMTVYHELDPTYYSATSKTFIGRVYALLGLKNIADAADKTGSGYPQLSAEYIVSASPTLIVLADTQVLRADAGEASRSAPAGARSRR